MSLQINITITVLLLFLFYILVAWPIIRRISNAMIFKPIKIPDDQYMMIRSHPYMIPESIPTNDGQVLDGCLYNSYRKPSYENDIIYLYSHGNSGWLGSVMGSTTIDYLANYGSIFIYDYRGYGKSTGQATDDGVFIDVISVWNYLVHVKKVPGNFIIPFGHSLGSSVTAKLTEYLLVNNINCSNIMILQNAFYSIQRLAKFVVSKFKTAHIIESIDNISKSMKLYLIHSQDDELIHYNHSVALHGIVRNNFCQLIIVPGSHDEPEYNDEVDFYISSIHRDPGFLERQGARIQDTRNPSIRDPGLLESQYPGLLEPPVSGEQNNKIIINRAGNISDPYPTISLKL
jgi:hypothetical protein